MGALLAFCRKEIRQALRDTAFLRILLVTPVVYMAVIGYIANTDVKNVRTIFVDYDRSLASRSLCDAFVRSGAFAEVARGSGDADVRDALDSGRAQVAVVIPPGYERTIESGQSADVQVIVDGTDTNVGIVARGYASSVIDAEARRIAAESAGGASRGSPSLASIDFSLRFWYNPTLATLNYMIPGLVAVILALLTLTLTAQSVVKERVSGTLEQLMVTPIKRWQFILGKILPYALVGLFDVFVLTGFAVFWFHVPFTGSFGLLVGLCALGEFALLGQGLLVSTLSETPQQASVWTQMLLLPSVLLSGFMFPISAMPRWIQWLTYVIPLRYMLEITRGVFLKSMTLNDLWPQACVLLVLGVSTFALAVSRFSKQLEV
jgi:ABC-2 type transport system permease protein